MSREQRFLNIDDLNNLPTPQWAIEGLFEVNSLVMLAGPEASYKSFMALDWILCMATGRSWQSRKTTPARILYVLGEGKSNVLKRIHAWMKHNSITKEERSRLVDNFRVCFDVPQMAMKSSVDNMLAGLEQENYTPNVIVIDTFARSFVGMDENSQKDTGLWIESADRLRQLGYTVLFLHHTGKNTEFGYKYRGSTAIAGAMDSSFVMHKDGNNARVKFFCSKQKDHEEIEPLYFNRIIVKPYDNDTEGSIVLMPAPNVDERFTPEGIAQDTAVRRLVGDPTFESDRARARELVRLFPTMSEMAAQSRVSRAKKTGEAKVVRHDFEAKIESPTNPL